MKSSEELKAVKDTLYDLEDAIRLARGRFDSVAVPIDLLDNLTEAWYLLSTQNEEQFPVLYAGPGRHPDHTASSCIAGSCGHTIDCATHNSNPLRFRGKSSSLDAPCDCKEKKESND